MSTRLAPRSISLPICSAWSFGRRSKWSRFFVVFRSGTLTNRMSGAFWDASDVSVVIVFETHSMSVDNEHGIATGWLDGRLSSTGKRLALDLGARRRDDHLAAVFSSDLGRAVETAEVAFEGTSIPIYRDLRLREC